MLIFDVPTGKICIMDGDRGKLEFLSIADYGKDRNIKADFLGITREINGVDDGNPMSLSEKWVVTISTQYGCSMGCKFCDVPKVGPGINATYEDIKKQIENAILVQTNNTPMYTKRLNIHFARMGEPSFNQNVIDVSKDIPSIVSRFVHAEVIHPVFTTMMPKSNKHLEERLQQWTCDIKNDIYQGDAGLQISINSTSDDQREYMFNGNSMKLDKISGICKNLPKPVGRKYAINIALGDGFEIDAMKMRSLFDPENFMVKITPLHVTHNAETNNILTSDGYQYYTPYKDAEESLKSEGFDVLVFIPSIEEDKSRITCGNAILSLEQTKI